MLLDGPLGDRVADDPDEVNSILFASASGMIPKGAGGITILQVGPDGFLYALMTLPQVNSQGEGTIYKIVPK